ncbi:protein-L-isoaspartate O-methyltransferase [Saccharopolyspora cebuensis]|uniref:Protein-L-isoaspartate O-methyltransferase n=1 Tax=Saccharopolyspora cebuensis TaxID=418759 RepID=A0ABV4CTI2_9PSEU
MALLKALQVRPGQRVLHIGLHTGAWATLLAHRGATVTATTTDLARIGSVQDFVDRHELRVQVEAADARAGWPPGAPYDAIIALDDGVQEIPGRWTQQLRPGGLLLAHCELAPGAGNPATLIRGTAHELTGTFCSFPQTATDTVRSGEPFPRTTDSASRRTTAVPPMPWRDDRIVWVLAHLLGMPAAVRTSLLVPPDRSVPTGVLSTPDGSWAEISDLPGPDGTWPVTESGPTRLWNLVEEAFTCWHDHGRPPWEHFQLSYAPGHQAVTLTGHRGLRWSRDSPDSAWSTPET